MALIGVDQLGYPDLWDDDGSVGPGDGLPGCMRLIRSASESEMKPSVAS